MFYAVTGIKVTTSGEMNLKASRASWTVIILGATFFFFFNLFF